MADERPCKGINVNVCVAEGCYDEACIKDLRALVDAGEDAR